MTHQAAARKVVIIGAGGHGREILDLIEAINAQSTVFDVVGFIVEDGYGDMGDDVNGKPIVGHFDWIAGHTDEAEFVCAVGSPALRRRLVMEAESRGARFCSLVHPSAIVTRWVTIGTGVVITAGCTVTNRVILGDHVHLNLHCTVSHDSHVGAFTTLAPGVHLAGRVNVSDGADLGVGANVIERINIGEWSVIGAGSTVIRDVPANSTAVGVPAKVIKTRQPGWHLE